MLATALSAPMLPGAPITRKRGNNNCNCYSAANLKSFLYLEGSLLILLWWRRGIAGLHPTEIVLHNLWERRALANKTFPPVSYHVSFESRIFSDFEGNRSPHIRKIQTFEEVWFCFTGQRSEEPFLSSIEFTRAFPTSIQLVYIQFETLAFGWSQLCLQAIPRSLKFP